MPIHPNQRKLYPKDWKDISRRIRFERAKGKCEWEGCDAEHGKPHPITGSIVVLTTMHLDHDPTNNDDTNLKAACQRCHNRYDMPYRMANRRTRRHGHYDVEFEEIQRKNNI